MKALSSLAVVALLAATLPVQAQQRPHQDSIEARGGMQPKAIGGPLKVLYRVAGVVNSADGAFQGIATSFHCTSISSVPETLKITVRGSGGGVVGTPQTTTLTPNKTETISTHQTNIFVDDRQLALGIEVFQGSAVIQATSNKVFCSAMIMDAAATVPQGVALHMVRFEAAPGTQE